MNLVGNSFLNTVNLLESSQNSYNYNLRKREFQENITLLNISYKLLIIITIRLSM